MKMFSCQGLRVTTVLSSLILLSCLLSKIASNSRKSFPSFPETTMRRDEKVAGSPRINQSVCLTIVRDFQPDAVDGLQLNNLGHSSEVIFVGFL